MASTECEQSEYQISEEMGEYLSSQYGVVVKILQCLTAKDLKNASKVCRSWESAAKKIVAAQTKLKWLFYQWNIRDLNGVPPHVAAWTAMCEHVYFDPDICLCFFSQKSFMKKLACNDSDAPCPGYFGCKGKHTFCEYMSSFLEPKCRLMLYPVSGVVSSDQDLSRTWEVDYHQLRSDKGKNAMSMLFLPKMEGVTTIPFSLTPEEQKTLDLPGGKNLDIGKLLRLPENEVVQAVLIFCGVNVKTQCTSVLLGKLQERQEQRIAAGGALMDKRHCFEGIIFCGPNVCAASIVLTENVREKKHVEQQIAKLKNCCLPTESSVAFMFSCLARGSDWYYNESDVESHFINETFPTTPVIGFFGSGELGVTCLPKTNEEMRHGSRNFWKVWGQVSRMEGKCETAETDEGPPRKIVHKGFCDVNFSYSTSIVLVSFNTAA